MAGEVNLIGLDSDPAAVYPTTSLLAIVAAWLAALISAGLYAKLFANDFVVAAGMTLNDIVEPTAPGYAPMAVSAFDGPYLDNNLTAYATTAKLTWTTTGGGTDIIYGAVLCQVTGAAATATATGSGGAYETTSVTGGGSGYEAPPKVTATGATGSGAVFTAVLTAGVVTSLVMVSPGTGYTTYLISIEAPLTIVEAGNLPTPQPLQKVTDAVEVVFELQIPSTI